MLKEYITGSYMVYERNPLYWETTTINGKEYPIPFIDELVYAIIPDESTKIATLRTGKIDYSWGIPLRYEDTLKATCPDLSIEKAEGSWCHLLSLNLINSEIMENRNIRRALFIGTNREAVARAAWLEADLHSWPVSSKCPAVFTPFDELPASTQELYGYDPVKAKQMLADEGYPEGFQLRIPVDPGRVDWMDMVSLIADQWDEIGVELEIQATETVALQEIEANDYEGFDCWMWGEYNVDGLIALAHRVSDHSRELIPWFLERLDEASLTVDSAARNVILKDMNWHALDEALHIPLGTPYELNASWPWVKNWYGENEESAWGTSHINARIWIDQDLKAELGY